MSSLPASQLFCGDPLLEFHDVSFAYADGQTDDDDPHTVLDRFSFTLQRGDKAALLGPNGSGKTTIMRLINALEFPDDGSIRFCGTPITREAMADARFAKLLHQRIGFVFQNSATQLFCPSVREEIAFGPLQMGLPDAEVTRRTDDIIALFQLERLADRAPYRLSGGEKKRVAIACCLSLNPDLLVLDEPTDGLDEANTALVVEVLNQFAAVGNTLLLSTHHHDIVRALGCRHITMPPTAADIPTATSQP